MNLGQLIRTRRETIGLSRAKVVHAMYQYGSKANEQWLIGVESGRIQQPAPATLLILSRVLQLPVELLVRAAGPDGVPDDSLTALTNKPLVTGVRDALSEDVYKMGLRMSALSNHERRRVLELVERIMPDAKVSLTT